MQRVAYSGGIAWPLLSAAVVAVLAIGIAAQGNPSAAQDRADTDGGHVFMNEHCFVCHGEMGFGGIGPKFRGDHYLDLGDYVIGQILMGRGIMPGYAERLSDQQIAAVATYIRTSWGNQYGEIKAEQVAQLRSQLSGAASQNGSSQPPDHH
jgi:mono/diheme cytochrome c family protein